MKKRIKDASELVERSTRQGHVGVSEIGGGPQDLVRASIPIVLQALMTLKTIAFGDELNPLNVYWIGFSGASDLFILMQLASVMEFKLAIKGVEIDAAAAAKGMELISTLKECNHTSVDLSIGNYFVLNVIIHIIVIMVSILYTFVICCIITSMIHILLLLQLTLWMVAIYRTAHTGAIGPH